MISTKKSVSLIICDPADVHAQVKLNCCIFLELLMTSKQKRKNHFRCNTCQYWTYFPIKRTNCEGLTQNVNRNKRVASKKFNPKRIIHATFFLQSRILIGGSQSYLRLLAAVWHVILERGGEGHLMSGIGRMCRMYHVAISAMCGRGP